MKKNLFLCMILALILPLLSISVKGQKAAVYSFPVEIELNNDLGDMSAKDYLKNYGTRGKKRGNEYIYEVASPFLFARLTKAGYKLLPIDTLAGIKANEYGKPSTTLAKAVATGLADEYIKVYLKDITLPVVEGLTQQDQNAQQKKLVKMRCRIQVYDAKKALLKDVEGVFQSGEKIENAPDLGVDLRKYQGSDFLQELKIYETCTKMAIIKAIGQLGK